MADSERFLHDTHTNPSFVTIARRDPDAPKTCGSATSALQSFAEVLQTLNALDPRPQPVFSMIDHTADRIDVAPCLLIYQRMQGMIASEVGRIVDANIQTRPAHAAREAWIHM